LIQEEFAHDPFNLLIAVIFLNKTRGKCAIPIFRQVVEMFPTPAQLAEADAPTLSFVINALGLQNQRAQTLIKLAQSWISDPPSKSRRHRTLQYPYQGAGKDIKVGDVLPDNDPRLGAWEIGHLPGLGPYAFDSWRIFCRDKLRGVATGWNGEGAGPMFEPEWKRVLPQDKELRAILRWMWLREGWAWNPITGEKEVASEELMKRAEKGGLEWDARADQELGENAKLPPKTNDLGIIQSFPKEDTRILVRSSRNGGQRINPTEPHEDEAPSNESEDSESEPDRPNENENPPSSSESPSSSSSESPHSDPSALSDSSEVESEALQEVESFERGKAASVVSRIAVAEHADSEYDDSKDEDSEMEEPIAKRRRTDVAGSGKMLQERAPSLSDKVSEGKYRCNEPGCNKAFVNAKGRRRHIEAVHERRRFICTFCNASLSRADKLTNHMKKKHSASNNINCTACDESFWTSDLLNRHVRTVHKEFLSFNCTVCDMKLSRKDKFKNHLRTQRHLMNVEEHKRKFGDTKPLDPLYDYEINEILEQDEVAEMGSAEDDEDEDDEEEKEAEELSGCSCAVCDVKLSRRDKLENHYLTARHARNVAEQERKRVEQKKRKVNVLYDEEVFEKDVEMESASEEDEEEIS
jgi:methyl-CpG-binding domain protein 4